MTEFCKNHPDQEAKRKCYHCKESICNECQITKFHHLFCSKLCIVKYVLFVVWTHLVEAYKFTVKHLTYFWSRLKQEPSFLILFSILFFGLIISIILSIVNISRLQKLQTTLDAVSARVIVPDSIKSVEEIAKSLDTLTVFTPPADAMIIQNKIDIEGETEENHVVTISADGQLLQVSLVTGGKFVFEDVLVKPGQNHFIVRSMTEDGSSIVLEEITFKYGAPTPSFLAADFTRGRHDEKSIALTFDGDYLDNITNEILDVLKQEHVRCTIFLTGRYIRRYSQHIRRMLDDGHEIGNHTWTHPHLTTFEQNRKHQTRQGITKELVQQELLKTAELYCQISGQKMKPYWRAPYGEHNLEIRTWVGEIGFRQIGWTVGRDWENGMDTLDWVADTTASYYYSADEIADKILTFGEKGNNGANGAVILMHLGTLRNGDYPHQKLPYIIKELKRKGYRFVTISEMLF